MPYWFNTAGPCKADIHYMLPPTVRLPNLERLIAQQNYFRDVVRWKVLGWLNGYLVCGDNYGFYDPCNLSTFFDMILHLHLKVEF